MGILINKRISVGQKLCLISRVSWVRLPPLVLGVNTMASIFGFEPKDISSILVRPVWIMSLYPTKQFEIIIVKVLIFIKIYDSVA